MIQVFVLYKYEKGGHFDQGYYTTHHANLVKKNCQEFGLQRFNQFEAFEVDEQNPPPYLGGGYLVFDTIENFHAVMEKHGEEFLADVPNFTNLDHTILVSKITHESTY